MNVIFRQAQSQKFKVVDLRYVKRTFYKSHQHVILRRTYLEGMAIIIFAISAFYVLYFMK